METVKIFIGTSLGLGTAWMLLLMYLKRKMKEGCETTLETKDQESMFKGE